METVAQETPKIHDIRKVHLFENSQETPTLCFDINGLSDSQAAALVEIMKKSGQALMEHETKPAAGHTQVSGYFKSVSSAKQFLDDAYKAIPELNNFSSEEKLKTAVSAFEVDGKHRS